jgi:transcriptional regulator with XRE-family HTH domain
MLHEQVGERIARYRKARRLTQAELGMKMARARSHAAVSDIERGATKPTLDDLQDIAVQLETTLPELLGFEAPIQRRASTERLFIARTLLAYVALLLCENYDPNVSEASMHITRAQVRLSKALGLED